MIRPIDKKLKREVIQHFEYVWQEKKGKELYKVINKFSRTMQQDILFDLYGKQLMKSQVFEVNDSSFFKSLLLTTKHQIVLNLGIICRVSTAMNLRW